MQSVSSVAAPVRLVASTTPTAAPVPDGIAKGRSLADDIKSRSTLVGLIQPAGMVGGLLQHPSQSWQGVTQIFNDVVHWDPGRISGDVGKFSTMAVHPDGVSGVVYNSGLGAKAAIGGVVGGLELFQGIKNGDKFLAMMGGVDMIGVSAGLLQMTGNPLPSMGVSLACAATKMGLVFARPQQYSRIQKASAIFEMVGAATGGLLQAGIIPGPITLVSAVVGPFQILYFNVKGFRDKVDHTVDWVVDHFPH